MYVLTRRLWNVEGCVYSSLFHIAISIVFYLGRWILDGFYIILLTDILRSFKFRLTKQGLNYVLETG